MKAIVQDRYGSADVLRLAEIDRPTPKDGEVLVRVRAAGVDPSVWHLMTGLPRMIRLGFGLTKPRTPIRGFDLSGVVETVGAGVTRFRPGDEVYGGGLGAFAEYACAHEDRLVTKPAGLSFEQAAAVPVSSTTALQALRDQGKLTAGQRTLVIGAGGGVGTYAVQIAKALGAHVTGVCGTGKVDMVRSIGADEVIDYTATPLAGRFDLIIDTAGNRPLTVLRGLLTPRGTIVIVGGEDGGMGRSIGGAIGSGLHRQKVKMFVAKQNLADLETVRGLIEQGSVRPVLGPTYPLAQAADAIRYWEQGHATGKIVLTI